MATRFTKLAEFKINLPWFSNYLAWVIFLILAGLSYFFRMNPIILTFLFFLVLAWPGFGLSRIFKLELGQDLTSKFLTWVLLGLMFALLLSLIAMLGLTLNLILIFYILIGFLLFSWSFILDLKRKEFSSTTIGLRQLLPDYWSIIIVFAAIFILTVINDKGSILKGGDALYHLSILRKVVSNEPLTITNLSYTLSNFHIAYIFPIWHIFLGLFAKIARIDIFILWQNLALALSLFAILVWAWVTRIMFPTRQLQAIGLLFFMIFAFNWGSGYLFTTIIIPHSLSQLIILPLGLGLALNYIFKLSNLKWLIILTLFLGLSLFVHLTGYFYYLCLMGMFFIIFAVTQFKTENYRQNLLRIILSAFTVLIVFVPLLILWKLRGQQAFSDTLAYFYGASIERKIAASSISNWSIKIKYALIALPLLLPFVRKNRSFLLLVSSFVILPIIYFSGFREIIFKTVGFVWLKRLQETVLWYYLVWAIIIAFLLLMFDLLISRFNRKIQQLIEISVIILTGLFIYGQIKFQIGVRIHDAIFNHKFNPWLDQNYIWLMITLALLSLVAMWFMYKKPNLSEIIDFYEPRKPLLNAISIIAISIVLVSPSVNDLAKADFRQMTKPVKKISSTETSLKNYVGGQKVIDYIDQNIESTAIFDCFDCPYYLLPVINVKKPTYTNTTNDLFYDLYSAKTPINDKLKILSKAKLDYLLISNTQTKLSNIKAQFDAYPQYFANIFTDSDASKGNHALIYKVNQVQVATDLNK